MLAFLAVALLATPGRAATGGPYRILQFNFCGNADNDSCNVEGSTGAAVDAAVSSILDFKPHVVTLNEICANQLTAMATRLKAKGFPMYLSFRSTSRQSSLRCTDDNYGIGFLSRRPMSAVGDRYLQNAGSTCTLSTEECRYVRCVTLTLLVATKVCVTHIGTSGQGPQIRQVVSLGNGYASSLPVIIAGDLNVRPDNDALDIAYRTGGGGARGGYDEADACADRTSQTSTCNEGTIDVFGTDPKIDYVFASARDFYGLTADATSATYSDHDPVRAVLYQCSTRTC